MTRRRRERETPEVAAMVERMLRAYGRRVADGDPVDLARLVEIRKAFDQVVVEAVRGQHEEGFSWAELGEAMGTSRQAVQARFGSPVPRQRSA